MLKYDTIDNLLRRTCSIDCSGVIAVKFRALKMPHYENLSKITFIFYSWDIFRSLLESDIVHIWIFHWVRNALHHLIVSHNVQTNVCSKGVIFQGLKKNCKWFFSPWKSARELKVLEVLTPNDCEIQNIIHFFRVNCFHPMAWRNRFRESFRVP